jgi:hypothetical protein
MSWDEKYPHSIYANVLLDEEGKILNWKTVNYCWREPAEVKMYYKQVQRIDKFTVQHKEFIVNNDYEHNKVFEVDAVEFYKQFELAKDHIGTSPFEKDDFFNCEGVEIIKKK